MMNFNSFGLNATLAAATVTVVSLAVAPVQAVTLTGSIGFDGASKITQTTSTAENTATIRFGRTLSGATLSGNPLVSAVEGDYTNLLNRPVVMKNLVLHDPEKDKTYFNDAITSWLNFGNVNLGGSLGTGALTFDLDGGSSWLKTGTNSNFAFLNVDGISGVFNFNGVSFATGFINASKSSLSSTFQITLASKATPEPSGTIGLGMLLGLGALGLRKSNKKQAS